METEKTYVPPPPLEADIIDMARWLAAVAAVGGTPEHLDVTAASHQASVTLSSERDMASWSLTIGAVQRDSVGDALGTMLWAATVDPSLWQIELCAHLPGSPR